MTAARLAGDSRRSELRRLPEPKCLRSWASGGSLSISSAAAAAPPSRKPAKRSWARLQAARHPLGMLYAVGLTETGLAGSCSLCAHVEGRASDGLTCARRSSVSIPRAGAGAKISISLHSDTLISRRALRLD